MAKDSAFALSVDHDVFRHLNTSRRLQTSWTDFVIPATPIPSNIQVLWKGQQRVPDLPLMLTSGDDLLQGPFQLGLGSSAEDLVDLLASLEH